MQLKWVLRAARSTLLHAALQLHWACAAPADRKLLHLFSLFFTLTCCYRAFVRLRATFTHRPTGNCRISTENGKVQNVNSVHSTCAHFFALFIRWFLFPSVQLDVCVLTLKKSYTDVVMLALTYNAAFGRNMMIFNLSAKVCRKKHELQ